MNLSVGLDIARAGLAATSEQTALVSRNIAGANDPRVARKIANVVSGPDGAPRVRRFGAQLMPPSPKRR